jgi:hypothetical protein
MLTRTHGISACHLAALTPGAGGAGALATITNP